MTARVAAAAEALAEVRAMHDRTHWCFNDDEQANVYERGTEWWPCPTLAALDAQPGDAEQAHGLTDDERERRMAAVSDEAMRVAEDVWTEDEPTLAEYELTERILAARAAGGPDDGTAEQALAEVERIATATWPGSLAPDLDAVAQHYLDRLRQTIAEVRGDADTGHQGGES